MAMPRSSRKVRLQFWMGGRIGVATRRRGVLWLHKLDAIAIGVINVEGPFPVATDFRRVLSDEPVGTELHFRGLDVGNPQREVILHAEVSCGQALDGITSINSTQFSPSGT